MTFNPYTGCDHQCLYCYASSYIPKFSDCRPKKDLFKRLQHEASRLDGETVSIANSSDPYPRIEAELSLTRQCLQTLTHHNCRIQIITKSDIVTRDTDLLTRVPSTAAITITTLDDSLAKLIEPNAPPPAKRLNAIQTLTAKGIPVTARVDPIIPTLNDNTEPLIKTLSQIGVKHVTASTYKAKHDNWQRLNKALPETMQKLRELYYEKGEHKNGCTYLPKQTRTGLMQNVRTQTQRYGMTFGTCREGLAHLNTAPCDGSWLLTH